MTKTISKTGWIALLALAVLLALLPVTFAEARSRASTTAEERRAHIANMVDELVPDEAPVNDAVVQEISANDHDGGIENGDENGATHVGLGGAGGNGGVQTGSGGNGGTAAHGGLVRAGSVVSNATALNVLNAIMIRIGIGL